MYMLVGIPFERLEAFKFVGMTPISTGKRLVLQDIHPTAHAVLVEI